MKVFKLILFSFVLLSLFSCASQKETVEREIEKEPQSEPASIVAWKNLIEINQDKSEMEKLILVNNFFNQNIRWLEDSEIWKQKDYWATPVETLTKQAGDCEDFCIGKYYTLLSLGIPLNKLKMTYVKDIELNQAHMVLTYYAYKGSEPLVLDNKNKKILKGSQRTDLKPVYSFNGDGTWISKQNKLGQKVGSSGRNRLWAELSERMLKENSR
ncbi:MAG: transglutaminase-like cysteine peptidase [gamma proteobacterium symbiont of Taylorina sp.]|nr:transglutaminase-like cysteine peptidase [gamma proteobacterium symbiont of Taylorina sp.]